MAEDFGDRTEPATPRRRQEARRRGQVPRSHDLTMAATMLGALLLLRHWGPDVWRTLLAIMQRGLVSDDADDASGLAALSAGVAVEAARVLLPMLAAAVVLALVVTVGQVGLLLTVDPLTPTLTRLNPLAGLRRMLSPRSAMALLINLAKLVVVGLVAWLTLRGQIGPILTAVDMDHAAVLGSAAHLAFTLGVRLALALLVLALLDYAYQRYRHERDLRMTKEEVREELRRMEGDPVIKRRRRQVQMQLALQRIRAAVPKADVVVTNPTHLSIAIRYESAKMNAPVVVAKGADYIALRIREVASAHGVPIVERASLARVMYNVVEVGKEVPSRFYQAIAEILAYVYELTGRNMRPAPVPV